MTHHDIQFSPETQDEETQAAANYTAPLSFINMEEKTKEKEMMQKLLQSEMFKQAVKLEVKQVMQQEQQQEEAFPILGWTKKWMLTAVPQIHLTVPEKNNCRLKFAEWIMNNEKLIFN